ncbi:MAG: sulfurtransferase TusA family protein [Halanaerobiales bacterium]|nr:sulfurtransferase TusA family protein [Halanaerobiales bacterium]HKL42636.1 sulfurtransferase TusA family protein [Clostridia bacterium]
MSKEIKVNCMGENCPVPLVETRKAINKAKEGDILVITGDHVSSKKEIPMAVEAMDLELISVKDIDDYWEIKIGV